MTKPFTLFKEIKTFLGKKSLVKNYGMSLGRLDQLVDGQASQNVLSVVRPYVTKRYFEIYKSYDHKEQSEGKIAKT